MRTEEERERVRKAEAMNRRKNKALGLKQVKVLVPIQHIPLIKQYAANLCALEGVVTDSRRKEGLAPNEILEREKRKLERQGVDYTLDDMLAMHRRKGGSIERSLEKEYQAEKRAAKKK